MKTKKPLATIAYNEIRLIKGLLALYNGGYIGFFCYIRHNGEGTGLSEGKEHFHVYIEPATGLDPLSLKQYFNQEDGSPTCLNFRKSDFQNWYYYCLHDTAYLESKGLKREFAYEPSDMVPSSEEELDRLVQETDAPECCKVREALLSGESLSEMFIQGILKPSNANGIRIIKEALDTRGGKKYGNQKSQVKGK